MIYFLYFNMATGKFEEISKNDIATKSIILSLSKETKFANLFITKDVNMIIQRTARRLSDTIARSGYYHSQIGRIGGNFNLEISVVENMESISNSKKIEIMSSEKKEQEIKLNDAKITEEQYLDKEVKTDSLKEKPTKYSSYKISLLAPKLDNSMIINTLIEKDIQQVSEPPRNIIGMEPYARYDTVDGVKICYNLWLTISDQDRFDAMRGLYFQGVSGAMMYYNPDDEASIEYFLNVINELFEESPDVKICVIKCGLGDREIKENLIQFDNIIGFYEIGNEKDPSQREILKDLGRVLIKNNSKF